MEDQAGQILEAGCQCCCPNNVVHLLMVFFILLSGTLKLLTVILCPASTACEMIKISELPGLEKLQSGEEKEFEALTQRIGRSRC